MILNLLKPVCLLHVPTLCSFIVQDLIEDLKSELGGALETVVVALMKTPAEFDASTLRNAMKGVVRKNIFSLILPPILVGYQAFHLLARSPL